MWGVIETWILPNELEATGGTLNTVNSIRHKLRNLPSRRGELKSERHRGIYHVNVVVSKAKAEMN